MFQEVQMETEMNTDSGVETAESLPTGEIIMAKTEMEAESWLAEICYKIPTSFESQGRGFVATFTKIFPSWTQFIKKIAKIHENLSQTTTATAKRDPTQVIIGFILVPYLLNC